MFVVNADKVYINEYHRDTGYYSARSLMGSRVYNECIFMSPGDTVLTANLVGRNAMVFEIDGQNFIMGYFVKEDHSEGQIILTDGETLLKAGESKAIILSPTGEIGFYHIRVNTDGSLNKTPLLQYTNVPGQPIGELNASFSKMVLDMVGASAGGTIQITKDKRTGFYSYKVNGRGSKRDPSIRFQTEIKGTTHGLAAKFVYDISPSPVSTPGTIPDTLGITNPESIQMDINPSIATAFELAHKLLSIPNISIKIAKQAGISYLVVKTGPAGVGPSITLNKPGKYPVIISSNKANAATIKFNIAGGIVISGLTGIDLLGTNLSLLQTLIDIITALISHTHGTRVGPSTPPILGLPELTKALIQLKLIKGTAS